MPTNPNGKIFIHARKKTHIILMMVCTTPGYWGAMSISKRNRWEHNSIKRVVNKLISKGLLVSTARKLYPTELGDRILEETNTRII